MRPALINWTLVGSLLVQLATACFSPSANDTVGLNPSFLDAPNNVLVLNTIGDLQVLAEGPTVTGRREWEILIGGSPTSTGTSACGLGKATTTDLGNCTTRIELLGNWTTWAACSGWTRTLSAGQVTMTNYIHLSWTDVLSGGQERRHSTSMRVVANLDADVIVEENADLYIANAQLSFKSILYAPSDLSGFSLVDSVDIGYSVVLPCPFVPSSVTVSATLLQNISDPSAGTWEPTITNCFTPPTGTTSCDGDLSANMPDCNGKELIYNGTLSFLTYTFCNVDGFFYFNFTNGDITIPIVIELQDKVDLCAFAQFNANITATLYTVDGDTSLRNLTDPIYFTGNVTGDGLPLRVISIENATLFNLQDPYLEDPNLERRDKNMAKQKAQSNNRDRKAFKGIVPAYVQEMYQGASKSKTSFAQNSAWKAGFGEFNEQTLTPGDGWKSDAVLTQSIPTGNNAGDVIPYATALTPFAGSLLNDSWIVPEDYGSGVMEFGLQLVWRGYFDLQTAQLGRRNDGRTYLLKRDLVSNMRVSGFARAEAQLRIVAPPAEPVVFNKSAEVAQSNGAIIGVVVGVAAVLMLSIAIVGVAVFRRRKRRRFPKSR